jgi:hypothetical protein
MLMVCSSKPLLYLHPLQFISPMTSSHLALSLALELLRLALGLALKLLCLSLCLSSHLVRLALGLSSGLGNGLLDGAGNFLC